MNEPKDKIGKIGWYFPREKIQKLNATSVLSIFCKYFAKNDILSISKSPWRYNTKIVRNQEHLVMYLREKSNYVYKIVYKPRKSQISSNELKLQECIPRSTILLTVKDLLTH